jgi:hypothetical protein
MYTININKRIKMNFYGDNVRHWVGIVKEKVDETYVKVRIFGIHPLEESELSSSDLPLAVVLYPTTGAQMGFGNVSHNLEPDTWVMGISLDDTFMQPIITGVIQGTDYSMSTSSSGGGVFPNDENYTGNGENPNVDTTAVTNIPGGSNIEKTYNYVYSKLTAEGSSNDPHLHASALVGVLRLETTNINPAVVGGYKGRAWGICQWLGSRRVKLFKKYGRTKRLDHQLDFMWWELNGDEARAKRRWLSATNLPDAVAGFAAFERNENWDLKTAQVKRGHPNFKKQLRYAYEVYNTISHTKYPQENSAYRGPQ